MGELREGGTEAPTEAEAAMGGDRGCKREGSNVKVERRQTGEKYGPRAKCETWKERCGQAGRPVEKAMRGPRGGDRFVDGRAWRSREEQRNRGKKGERAGNMKKRKK